VIDWLGKLLFRKYDRAVRRKHVRFLGLALLLAMGICLIIAGFMYVLNREGRL